MINFKGHKKEKVNLNLSGLFKYSALMKGNSLI
jgi:hypothetical protein